MGRLVSWRPRPTSDRRDRTARRQRNGALRASSRRECTLRLGRKSRRCRRTDAARRCGASPGTVGSVVRVECCTITSVPARQIRAAASASRVRAASAVAYGGSMNTTSNGPSCAPSSGNRPEDVARHHARGRARGAEGRQVGAERPQRRLLALHQDHARRAPGQRLDPDRPRSRRTDRGRARPPRRGPARRTGSRARGRRSAASRGPAGARSRRPRSWPPITRMASLPLPDRRQLEAARATARRAPRGGLDAPARRRLGSREDQLRGVLARFLEKPHVGHEARGTELRRGPTGACRRTRRARGSGGPTSAGRNPSWVASIASSRCFPSSDIGPLASRNAERLGGPRPTHDHGAGGAGPDRSARRARSASPTRSGTSIPTSITVVATSEVELAWP